MGLDNEVIQVAVDDDKVLRCCACRSILKSKYIAALTRLEPGGPFDPMCVDCHNEVIRAARVTLETSEALRQLLN